MENTPEKNTQKHGLVDHQPCYLHRLLCHFIRGIRRLYG